MWDGNCGAFPWAFWLTTSCHQTQPGGSFHKQPLHLGCPLPFPHSILTATLLSRDDPFLQLQSECSDGWYGLVFVLGQWKGPFPATAWGREPSSGQSTAGCLPENLLFAFCSPAVGALSWPIRWHKLRFVLPVGEGYCSLSRRLPWSFIFW